MATYQWRPPEAVLVQLSEPVAHVSPVDLRPLTRPLGGRVDYGHPVRHALTCTCRNVPHTGTRQRNRVCPLEALRQGTPAHRLGGPSAWRLPAKNVLATPSTPQARLSGRPRQEGARQEMTRNGARCVPIKTLEVIPRPGPGSCVRAPRLWNEPRPQWGPQPTHGGGADCSSGEQPRPRPGQHQLED